MMHGLTTAYGAPFIFSSGEKKKCLPLLEVVTLSAHCNAERHVGFPLLMLLSLLAQMKNWICHVSGHLLHSMDAVLVFRTIIFVILREISILLFCSFCSRLTLFSICLPNVFVHLDSDEDTVVKKKNALLKGCKPIGLVCCPQTPDLAAYCWKMRREPCSNHTCISLLIIYNAAFRGLIMLWKKTIVRLTNRAFVTGCLG